MRRISVRSFGLLTATAAVAALGVTAMATLTTTTTPAVAQGNACVSACNSQHNQCRIATKGSSSCDSQLQACLRACIKP
jgi:anti-sigma-K factor RskA